MIQPGYATNGGYTAAPRYVYSSNDAPTATYARPTAYSYAQPTMTYARPTMTGSGVARPTMLMGNTDLFNNGQNNTSLGNRAVRMGMSRELRVELHRHARPGSRRDHGGGAVPRPLRFWPDQKENNPSRLISAMGLRGVGFSRS